MKSGLSISETAHGDVEVLSLTGHLDGHTSVELDRRIERLVAAGRKRLVIELSGLTYIASAGVGVFINGQHRAEHGGGTVQLANPSASVREIFSVLGLESLFVIHGSLDDGIKAARG